MRGLVLTSHSLPVLMNVFRNTDWYSLWLKVGWFLPWWVRHVRVTTETRRPWGCWGSEEGSLDLGVILSWTSSSGEVIRLEWDVLWWGWSTGMSQGNMQPCTSAGKREVLSFRRSKAPLTTYNWATSCSSYASQWEPPSSHYWALLPWRALDGCWKHPLTLYLWLKVFMLKKE